MRKLAVLILTLFFVQFSFAQHFTVSPESACGSASVTVENLHPSEGYSPEMFITTGFSYAWDFGNGETSALENPDPIQYSAVGQHEISYIVTIDTIGFELQSITLDGYLGCDDPFGGDVDVYIVVIDNEGNELVNTSDNADSYQVDPTENNHLEFNLGSINVGSNIPFFIRIMDSDSMDSDDNCIDDGEGEGSVLALQLPPNNENGFGETTKLIEASTPNGDLTITAHFNKPVLVMSQSITVDVFPLPAAPVLENNNLNVCVGSEMPEVNATGDNLQWYSDVDLTNLVHTGNGFQPILSVEDSTYLFYVTQTENVNACQSEASIFSVEYGTMEAPIFNSNNVHLCEGQILPDFIANGENIKWYSDAELTNLIGEGDTLEVSEIEVGNTVFYCTQSNVEATCVSDAAELHVEMTEGVTVNLVTVDANCYGSEDGFISVEVESGVEPFEFLWSNGETGNNLNNVPVGEYTLTIKDANFCVSVFDAFIHSPSELELNPVVESGLCPDDEFGSVVLNVSGGVAPYTYLWSDDSKQNSINGLLENSCQVTVTDANACQKSETIDIVKSEMFNVEPEVITASCPDLSDGCIHVSVTGGVEPYEYSWSNGERDTIIENLRAGDYTLNLTDFYGCQYTKHIALGTKYEVCLAPASVLTPNGDGRNDTWVVKFIELYPEAEIYIYSRTGAQVYYSSNYQSDWDGTDNGKPLPIGSYMYFIDLKDNSDPMRGFLDIIR